MAIANYKPDTTPTVTPSPVKIQPDNYKSVIYDDKNVPLSSLVAYLSGSPYTVDYYKQVTSEHNDLREIDPGQPNVYQKYELIHDLEIRVSGPLATSYDGDNAITTVNGNGNIYPFLVPNVADVFISDADDNRKGIFRITSVERKTFNRDSAFYVEYEMVGYVDALGALYDDLTSKVIREYHFSKDRLIEGLQPFLKTSDYEQVTSLRDWYQELVQYYFKTFFNRRYMTLVLPGQHYAIYDHFVVDYLMKIVDSFDVYEMKLIKQIPIDNDTYLQQPQFWHLLLEKDFKALTYCNRHMQVANKKVFNPNGFIHGLYFTNIDYIVYPETADLTTAVDNKPELMTVSLDMIEDTTNVFGDLSGVISNTYVAATTTYNLIHSVLTDSSYVLSDAFYTQSTSMSVLEILVKDYLKQQSISLPMLLALCQAYRSWTRLDQFYFIPILLTLIKEANRSTYT